MRDPIDVINKFKESLSEVIEENDIKYLGDDIDLITQLCCKELCSTLLNFYPGASIMMHKFYRSCAVLINNRVYDGRGEIDKTDYHIADEQEIGFIQKTFHELSEFEVEKLNEKIYSPEVLEKGISLVLRKNSESMT